MLKRPKYERGDTVRFEASTGVIVTGEVYMVDVYSYFINDGEILYDIKTKDILYKHVRENELEKVKPVVRNEWKSLVERM